MNLQLTLYTCSMKMERMERTQTQKTTAKKGCSGKAARNYGKRILFPFRPVVIFLAKADFLSEELSKSLFDTIPAT